MTPAQRRERNRLRRHAQSMVDLAAAPSERMAAKQRRQEAYLDQVTLDHEQGREISHIARALYREEQADAAARLKAQPAGRARRKGGPRPAATYRGAMGNRARGIRMALELKAERQRLGLSRPEMDSWRAARDKVRRAA